MKITMYEVAYWFEPVLKSLAKERKELTLEEEKFIFNDRVPTGEQRRAYPLYLKRLMLKALTLHKNI